MELILKGLSAPVMASHEEIHIEGTAPIKIPEAEKLVTIVQTSGCMFKSNQKPETVPFRITAQLNKVLHPKKMLRYWKSLRKERQRRTARFLLPLGGIVRNTRISLHL